MLQHIIQCIKLLSGVGWRGMLRYEDKLLYSWTCRWGWREGGRMKEKGVLMLKHKLISHHTEWLTWVSENWPVLGALKRTTKGSLEKASTSPVWLSGYWYWPVTVTVSVLKASRQNRYSPWCCHILELSGSSIDTQFISPINKYILLLVWVRSAQSLTGYRFVHMFSVIPKIQTGEWKQRLKLLRVKSGHEWQDSCVAVHWSGCEVTQSYCHFSPVNLINKLW